MEALSSVVEVRYLKGKWRAKEISGKSIYAHKLREKTILTAENYLAELGGELRIYDHRDGAKGSPIFVSKILGYS